MQNTDLFHTFLLVTHSVWNIWGIPAQIHLAVTLTIFDFFTT